MTLRSVDLSKLTSFGAPGVFRRFDPTLEEQMQSYPETLERLSGVVHFCAAVGRQLDSSVSNEDADSRRKNLRAALAEFATLDEAALIDTKTFSVAAPKMLSLDDPRIHIVRLLRHSNLHLAVSQIHQTSRQTSWEGHQFLFHIYYSPDIGTSVKQTDQAKKYQFTDLAMMIEWIEQEQRQWGLDHLILKTAEIYAQTLVMVCRP